MSFLHEPWAPLVLCGIVASILWVCTWVCMKASGRFAETVLGGFLNLVGGLVVTVFFGPVVLLVGAVLLAFLSIFWVFAAATGTFELERLAILDYMKPASKSEGKEADSTDEE